MNISNQLLGEPTVYIPNSFTPHLQGRSNGVNDLWKPVIGGGTVYLYTLQIYNRWGQLLFETTDPYKGWSGFYKGQLVQRGVYAYRITFSIKPLSFL